MVTTTTEFNSNYTDFNLYEEELFPIISIMIGNRVTQAALAHRYFTPRIDIEETRFNNETKSYEYFLLNSFGFIPCDKVQDEKVLSVLRRMAGAADDVADTGLCPDFKGSPNELRALRNLSSSTYRTVVVRMYPCSLPDPRHCASPLELAYANIAYTTNDRLLKSSNYDNPVTLSPEFRTFSIEVSVSKNRQSELRLNQLSDDTSVLRKPKVREEYATLHDVATDFKMRPSSQITCTPAQIELGALGGYLEYAKLGQSPSGKVVKTRRSYRKITTVLGEVGGFIKLATTLAFLLYSYYNARSVKNYIKNNLYNFGGLLNQKKSGSFRSRFYKADNKVHHTELGLGGSRTEEATKGCQMLVDKKKYDKVIEQCVADRRSGMDMMSKLDFVEIMQELFFERHDKVLLPLLILRLKEKKMQREGRINNTEKSKSKYTAKNNFNPEQTRLRPKRSIFAKKALIGDNSLRGEISENQGKEMVKEDEMDYQKAFEALKNSNPTTSIKQAIKGLMIDNIEILFADETQRQPEEVRELPEDMQPHDQVDKPCVELVANMDDLEEIETPGKSNLSLNDSVDLSSHLRIQGSQRKESGFRKFMKKKPKTKMRKKKLKLQSSNRKLRRKNPGESERSAQIMSEME